MSTEAARTRARGGKSELELLLALVAGADAGALVTTSAVVAVGVEAAATGEFGPPAAPSNGVRSSTAGGMVGRQGRSEGGDVPSCRRCAGRHALRARSMGCCQRVDM